MKPVLSVQGLEKRFGAVVAADALTLDIPAGQKISLIGANGAGKTTFVNMVTGYLKPDSGTILLDGIDIGRRSPRSVARLGISRSFQIPQLFVELTAAENLAVAISGIRHAHVPPCAGGGARPPRQGGRVAGTLWSCRAWPIARSRSLQAASAN